MWTPVPERCEEEREEHGEVVAPEPAVPIKLECSGVCRPIADRMLFPFIPDGAQRAREEIQVINKQLKNETGYKKTNNTAQQNKRNSAQRNRKQV